MINFGRPEILILLIMNIPLIYHGINLGDKTKKYIVLSKIITFSIFVIALSSPFIETDQELREDDKIVVLEDQSFSNNILDDHDLDFDGVEVDRRVIASGNSSNLKEGVVRNIEENESHLLVSDLQSDDDLDGLSDKVVEKNSSLNLLKAETEDEVSVSIDGPESTVPGARNLYKVNIYSTLEDEVVEPSVVYDGEEVPLEKEDENTWTFDKMFSDEGVEELKAEVEFDGYFESNKKYYKAVDVREKPEILVLGSENPLGGHLEDFYEVSYSEDIPSDIDEEYYTVIATEGFEETEVLEYVTEGNGLIYTGEVNEEYNILPATPVEEEDSTDGAEIMLVIDASTSAGETEQGSIQEAISIAYGLVDNLPYNNEVGALVYTQEANLITEPEPLAYNRDELMDKISRIETEGNTFHHKGLRGVEEVMEDEGNVIMISDGIIHPLGENVDTREKSLDIASRLDQQLITVGVGDRRDEDFLKELSSRGNGFYLDSDDSGRLSFAFDAGGAEERTGELFVVDPNHFITRDFEVSAQALGYDSVEPKRGADLLVSSAEGDEFLTSWNYGLGRVAAFSGDDKYLSNIVDQEPGLITRTVSWAVGDTERHRDDWLEIESGREGESIEVSSSEDLEGLNRESEDLYTGTIEADEPGFHEFNGKTYSFNYNSEIERIGYNEENKELIGSTGGEIYSVGDENRIVEELKSSSDRYVSDEKSLTKYLILAGLAVLLSEIGYRKFKGVK